MRTPNLSKREVSQADVDAFMRAEVYGSIKTKYRTAYAYYQKLAAEGFKVEPEPVHPEMIKEFTPEALRQLEKAVYLTSERNMHAKMYALFDAMHLGG